MSNETRPVIRILFCLEKWRWDKNNLLSWKHAVMKTDLLPNLLCQFFTGNKIMLTLSYLQTALLWRTQEGEGERKGPVGKLKAMRGTFLTERG